MSCCILFLLMKTKIAIFTKAESSAETKTIIAGLQNYGGFDICEVKSGQDVPSDCDNLVVFGGDGTVLEAVKNLREGVIVTGINAGNLGFLTQFEKDSSIDSIVAGIKSGEYEKRLTLQACCDNFCTSALNEIVLRTATSRPVFIDVYVDGKFVDSYHSDGAIVSSPTGSTAYSLSAGGPVLAPDVDAIVIIPICAHSLHSRPLVVSSNSRIELELIDGENATLCCDGENIATIKGNKCITIEKSRKSIRFLAVKEDNFYKKLLTKMNRWGSVDPRG